MQALTRWGLCVFATFLLTAPTALGQAPTNTQPGTNTNLPLAIQLPQIELASDLGTGDPENLKRFLVWSAHEPLRHTPTRKVSNIRILAATGLAPGTHYDRTAQNEIQIAIPAQGGAYAVYVYQFSHELTHVLCNYELKHSGDKQWFEEAICETASQFVCKRVFAMLEGLDQPWKLQNRRRLCLWENRNWKEA